MPVRFVVVSTTLRGVLETPELLDEANQWRAFSAWREDESRIERAEFELAYEDCEVVWAKKPVHRSWLHRVYPETEPVERIG